LLGWTPSCPGTKEVIERLVRETPRVPDPRIVGFLALLSVVTRAKPIENVHGVDQRVHLEVTGPRGGDFTVHIANEHVSTSFGRPPSPDSSVSVSAETFLDLLRLKIDPATAKLTGKVRMKGEPIGGMMLDAMITAFNAAEPARWVRRAAGLLKSRRRV
jgi:putative sterol carrier protein